MSLWSVLVEEEVLARLALVAAAGERVAVPLRGLDEWLKIRRRIGAVASIKRVDLARLSIDAAEVEILYIGNSGQLALAMAQSGLALKFVPGSALWILRIVEGR